MILIFNTAQNEFIMGIKSIVMSGRYEMYSLETSYRTSDLTTRDYLPTSTCDVANIQGAILRLNFTSAAAILYIIYQMQLNLARLMKELTNMQARYTYLPSQRQNIIMVEQVTINVRLWLNIRLRNL